jgi:hypothetical protein
MNYSNMSETQFIEALSRDMQEAGTRLLNIAMAVSDRNKAETLVRASEAVLVAARKVSKHTTDYFNWS